MPLIPVSLASAQQLVSKSDSHHLVKINESKHENIANTKKTRITCNISIAPFPCKKTNSLESKLFFTYQYKRWLFLILNSWTFWNINLVAGASYYIGNCVNLSSNSINYLQWVWQFLCLQGAQHQSETSWIIAHEVKWETSQTNIQ